ncbi:hypothetical protein ACOCG7_02350 [Paraburkholderia sp. DD10]|jgi:hypothetical protein|uniref:Uncharacterized protein n=1 Tax=Paraburkholderia terricola TaxID=169427 RepID=A0A1M6VH08_9BURK|nr:MULTISPECIES: hypothetical protein [Paraburkholderia]AXE95043.1 hypothetical protein CUJ90_22090 [Paraburkholderia terricola]SDP06244.1 hypothetical protein SAMN05192547_103947 [Paraburkholderia sediminicola]SHK80803.1 hypothetical protein SAMN05192548_103918 [Paraburkholderia terricola]
MFVVYWLESGLDSASGNPGQESARFRRFDPGALAEALKFTEVLRNAQLQGGGVSFVTLCSENPQSVGRSGAADPPADYAWKKRRS